VYFAVSLRDTRGGALCFPCFFKREATGGGATFPSEYHREFHG